VGTRLSDHTAYAHLWGTDETRTMFDERGRLDRWLQILVALAEAQAELGIIPQTSAAAIANAARVDDLDIDYVAEQTRLTSHSTLGLIRGLQRLLPADVAEHVYYGATVQDLTDTWFSVTMRDVGDVLDRDLRQLLTILVALGEAHQQTVMPGRTHGQPGAPMSFGFKVASWADELARHVDRLHDGRRRWATAQLGSAIGTLGFYGAAGPELRAGFARRLELSDPDISWFTCRDRIAEFASVLMMITGTLARVGNEVMELQRPELGELREATNPTTVGSIMMPHKRNPEASEHLDTLARLTRANGGVLIEGMVQLHERDGRGWKAEWVALPEICLLATTSVRLAIGCVAGLEIDAERMRANVESHRGHLASEQVLGLLAARLGKHRAQARMQELLGDGRSMSDALGELGDVLTDDERAAALAHDVAPGDAAAVSAVIARVRAMLA
jgi:adenylosuccinate lyase